MDYCTYCLALPTQHLDRRYHDTEYGFPAQNDHQLFERLMLEINQAGLSWHTILKKRPQLQSAFAQFDINTVAQFDETDIARLLQDSGIIRHEGKIRAAVFNAQKIQQIQRDYGSFAAWLEQHKALFLPDWVKLFKRTFKFTGGEITRSFLLATGYLDGAHRDDCPIQHQINASKAL